MGMALHRGRKRHWWAVRQVYGRARKVLELAQEEAQELNHNYIGTEHLLLGWSAKAGGSRPRR